MLLDQRLNHSSLHLLLVHLLDVSKRQRGRLRRRDLVHALRVRHRGVVQSEPVTLAEKPCPALVRLALLLLKMFPLAWSLSLVSRISLIWSRRPAPIVLLGRVAFRPGHPRCAAGERPGAARDCWSLLEGSSPKRRPRDSESPLSSCSDTPDGHRNPTTRRRDSCTGVPAKSSSRGQTATDRCPKRPSKQHRPAPQPCPCSKRGASRRSSTSRSSRRRS